MKVKNKVYIGDGVFVECDGFLVKLTTEDGFRVTNEIYLESEVLDALQTFLKPAEE